jgi:hypothetical protein
VFASAASSIKGLRGEEEGGLPGVKRFLPRGDPEALRRKPPLSLHEAKG